MRTRDLVRIVAPVLLLAAPGALAGPRDVAVNVTRLGGDSASAQPFIDEFLRYVESAVGWPAASTKGSFLVSKKEALAFIAGNKPGIGIVEPPLYFEMRKAWNLRPILQVESDDLVVKRLHVVVKDPGLKTLADLKGRRLWTLLADYPTYLSKVVLAGQVDASTHFALKQVGQALKGVRGVIRGDCDAAVLDDEQLAEARKITGGQDLRAVFTSPALPPIPVVLFGAGLPEADRDALVKGMTAMCGTGKGGEICGRMHIGRFVPVDTTIFADAQKRYGE